MDDDMINKIFKYNIYWLSDEKNVRDYIVEKADSIGREIENIFMTGKQIRDIRAKRGVPRYIKGSLIDNSDSIELKEAVRSKFFSADITKIFVELNRFCVVDSIYRYKQCDSYSLSRPLITLITTKENAKKLRYLKNQTLKFEYLAIDYEKVRYSSKESKRKNKPSPLQYRTMSDNFNNFLSRSVNETDPDGDLFYYIPTELERKKISNTKNFMGSLGNISKRKREALTDRNNQIKRLERSIQTAKITGKYGEEKRLKDQLDSLLESNKSQSLRQLVVKKDFRLESDYEYKKILERFKVRVDDKLKMNLNLDEWSYCVVFSPLWCDSENFPRTEKGGIDLLSYISESFKGIKSFNALEKPQSIDYSLLYFLKSCFESPKLPTPALYVKVDELKNFDVVLRGFKEFPNGGYWIKKIVKEKGIYKEKTEGPYSIQDADNRVGILKNIMYLDDVDVARYYTFDELVCNDDLTEIEPSDEIGRYVLPKHRYYPPAGASLFCLIKGMTEVVLINREGLTTAFKKFSDYAINSGMRYISTENFYIFFNPDSHTSVRKAGELRALLRIREKYTPDEFLWLIDEIIGRKEKRGTKPNNRPFAILSEYQTSGRMVYDGFKELFSLIDGVPCHDGRLDQSFSNFRESFGNRYMTTYRNKEFQIRKELRFSVLQDEEDTKPKKFRITRNYNETYEVGLHRIRKNFKDIHLSSVRDIGRDCVGYLNIKFKDAKDKTWEVGKLNLLSMDDNFNNEIVLMCLNLFVAKAFGVEKVVLDNRLRNSDCQTDIMYHYYHIHYVAVGDFKMFSEIGFTVENFQEYENLVNNIRDKKILEFVAENELSVKVNDEVKGETLKKFCTDFIETRDCFTRENLILINQISAHIQNRIQIKIVMDMGNIPFEKLLRYITF